MSTLTPTTPFLSNRTYNFLKWIAQIFLPAAGSLYFTLSEIWGLPYGVEIVGTITAVDLFLGLLLGLSTKQYNNSDAKYDGAINVHDTEEKTVLTLDVSKNPSAIQTQPEVLFKVNHEPGELAP